jgi:hypothetical protein
MYQSLILIVLLAIIGTLWVNRAHLHFSELNKYRKDGFFPLSERLLFRFTFALAIALSIIFSPIISYIYPRIPTISKTFPFGEVYSIIIVPAFFIVAIAVAISDGESIRNKKFRKFGSFIERLALFGLSENHRLFYDRHGHWRWVVLRLRFFRWLRKTESVSLQYKRIGLLIFATGIAYVIFIWLVGEWDTSHLQPPTTIKKLFENPSSWSPILIISGLPIAFMIWLFRDQNNREQIENQRKDINLRDFQKLAEWATGTHLLEDKTTETVKRSRSISSGDSINNLDENIITTESYGSPKDIILRTPGRRDAAAALQIAAVYQLARFLQGDFGKHFQRPAFQLLRSIWLVLMQNHLNEFPSFPYNDQSDLLKRLGDWKTVTKSIMGHGLGEALILVLGAERGLVLRNNSDDLPNIVLAAFDTQLPALKNQGILQGIDLEGLRLRGAQLQGANLRVANLQRADCFQAQLQGANLEFANLQESDLSLTRLDGANLNGAFLQGARLGGSIMFGATMFVANLRHAVLSGTDLRCAKLDSANLEGAILMNIEVNDTTSFADAKIDNETRICVGIAKKGVHGVNFMTFESDYEIDEIKSHELREKLLSLGLKM